MVDLSLINDEAAYTIAETCRIVGIHRNTLLNYTNAHRIERTEGTRAMYLGRDIKRMVLQNF